MGSMTALSLIIQDFKVMVKLTETKRQILDSSKLKGFADNNSNFNENGR